jgi:hypothetical protein
VCVGPVKRVLLEGPPVELHIASETALRRRSPPPGASVGTACLCNVTFHVSQKKKKKNLTSSLSLSVVSVIL